jgi:hypothetical protein
LIGKSNVDLRNFWDSHTLNQQRVPTPDAGERASQRASGVEGVKVLTGV